MRSIAIFIPTLKKGGAEKQAALLAAVMAQENRVFFVLFFPDLGIEQELVNLICKENIELIKLQGSLLSKLKHLYFLLRKEKIEVMFCYLTQPNFWGSIIGKLAGVKKVFQGIRSTFLPKSKIVGEKIARLFSDGVVVNCYAAKEIFEKSGITKITVIPNCYINPKEVKRRGEKQEVTIISVGRFVFDKDYRTALEAIAELKKNFKGFKYQIVGYGELESQIREWIVELGLSDNVEILINPKNIPAILDRADIYLSTSLFEGTSNSIMEALDASLPVVATNVGDNYIMVEEGENGFLTKIGDINALGYSLLKLAQNYQLRKEMGEKSNDILKKKYSIEKFRERYLKLIG